MRPYGRYEHLWRNVAQSLGWSEAAWHVPAGKWLDETIGGLEKMEALNVEKANVLYDFFDSSDFYSGTAEKDSRSLMNVTFRLPSEELEQKFVTDALANQLGGLKGHRSVGGCRASIYNATSRDAIEALVDFMKEFEKKNG